MKRLLRQRIIQSIIILIMVVFLIPSPTSAEIQIYQEESNENLEFFTEVFDMINKSYPFDIGEEKLIQAAVKAMLQSVDPYSDYYTKEEADSKYSTITGNFSGIGIYIEEKNGYINVVNTIKGQPAEKAGLKKDDLIISVDEVDIKGIGLDKASTKIKGPKGTMVKIGVMRGDEILTFEVVRDNIIVNPVNYEILDRDIGYIQIEDFNSQTTAETKEALKVFASKNITKVILDLRDNLGGLFDEAIEVSRLFVSGGPIVHVRSKDNSLVTHNSTLAESKYELVVLINENSASASEIVAGAIKDNKAGKLIGQKTFGKGIIQSLIPITDGSMIKLTTAEYLTPRKRSIHGKGIYPNIIIRNLGETDHQLNRAIQYLQ